MSDDWVDLGPTGDFPEGAAVLKKAGGHRLACVRVGSDVHAIDDRCPHQGYPLAEGAVNGCVLTCAWHNWKFDLKTGECLFGGEGVRRYPTRTDNGRVAVRLAIDRTAERARLTASLRAAMFESDVPRAVRDGLRLSLEVGRDGQKAPGPLSAVRPACAVLARDAAERVPWGFDHGLAVLADLCAWIERGWLDATEAFAVAALVMGELNQARHPRARVEPATEPVDVAAALATEARDRAEAGVRRLVREGSLTAARDALTAFNARCLYDYGHGAIFLTKALELAERFPDEAEEVMASLAVMLGWATAETALPPFAATRAALDSLGDVRVSTEPGAGFDRAAYETSVLEGERAAVTATVGRLSDGCAPRDLLIAIAHAAAERLARFDSAWESRLEAEVGVLDVTHAVTYAEAALRIAEWAPPPLAARLCVIGAGFVGKLRRGDGPTPKPRDGSVGLVQAVRTRDVAGAIAAAANLGSDERRATYKKLAPFFAFEVAVRPIFIAHAIKVAEAMHRLDVVDPRADGTYLRALLAFTVPRRPERNPRRIATVAKKFLTDGRPPEALY